MYNLIKVTRWNDNTKFVWINPAQIVKVELSEFQGKLTGNTNIKLVTEETFSVSETPEQIEKLISESQILIAVDLTNQNP